MHKIHLPALPFVAALKIARRCGLGVPVKAEQIFRLNENKTFDFDDARRDFNYTPRSFAAGISWELREMGII